MVAISLSGWPLFAACRTKSGDPPNKDWPSIDVARQTLDQGKIVVGAFAAHLDIHPMSGATDMGVAQPMIRTGVEALIGVDEAHTRTQEDHARPEIAAEQKFVGSRGLGAAADSPFTDLPECLVKARRVRRDPRLDFLMEDLRRSIRVEATYSDLV